MERQTREEIEKYCEKFEKDMLRTFDKAYRKGDPKMMKVGPHRRLFQLRSIFTLWAIALCLNSAGVQRWSIVRADLRQSARFLHFQESRQRGECH